MTLRLKEVLQKTPMHTYNINVQVHLLGTMVIFVHESDLRNSTIPLLLFFCNTNPITKMLESKKAAKFLSSIRT